MNGKLKRQLLKLDNAVIELRKNNEKFSDFTFSAEKYSNQSIEIFNINNNTSEISDKIGEDTIVQKFKDNVYLRCTIRQYNNWEFIGKLKLIEVKDGHIHEVVSLEDIFDSQFYFRIKVEQDTILSFDLGLKENDLDEIYLRIRDEKILQSIVGVAIKMAEMAKDMQDEMSEILSKLREENCKKVLTSIIGNKEEE
jgi:hypothetical protein|nr:MAG TPA: hypothetical protein [Caudoviricetes sp.]